MNRDIILEDIEQSGGAEIAALQKKFSLPYKEIKTLIDELVAHRILVFESGVRYVCVRQDEIEKSREFELDCRKEGTLCARRGLNPFSTEEEEKKRRTFLEMRRRELLMQMKRKAEENGEENEGEQCDEEEAGDDDESDDTARLIAYEDFLKRNLADTDSDEEEKEDDENTEGKNREKPMQDFLTRAHNIANKGKAQLGEEKIPTHPSWKSETEFEKTVMERLERLVKSDRRMGWRGAVKKAEIYLDAVRDTRDQKKVQVYERLVYELKNTGSYYYSQLKKRLFEE